MKQKLIILIAFLSISLYTNAQEYRLAKSSGQLKLNITGVVVEGYDGKDIIFTGEKVASDDQDERARGLVPITSSKYVDNTGLGINVTDNEGIVNVNLVSKKPIGVLTIKVPNNIKVSINNNNNNNRVFFSYINFNDGNTTGGNKNGSTTNAKGEDEIVIKNLKSELEVSVYWNKIRLENNSGPMNIKTVSGSVDAIFNGEVKGPISIVSANNYVDVTLPSTTKANIEMGTSYGKLYAGKEFKIDYEKIEPEKGNQRLIASTHGLGNIVASTRRKSDDESAAVASGTISSSTSRTKATGTISKDNSNKNDDVTIITTSPDTKVTGLKLNGGTHIVTDLDHATAARTIYSTNGFFSSGDRIKGKLNGGGIDLIFKSTNKNVYLRQQ